MTQQHHNFSPLVHTSWEGLAKARSIILGLSYSLGRLATLARVSCEGERTSLMLRIIFLIVIVFKLDWFLLKKSLLGFLPIGFLMVKSLSLMHGYLLVILVLFSVASEYWLCNKIIGWNKCLKNHCDNSCQVFENWIKTQNLAVDEESCSLSNHLWVIW